VQGQAKTTLVVAAAFALVAPVAAVVPHDTGAWLPLHLLLVGALVSAISGATQMLAVTWSAAPAPGTRLVAAQRWSVVTGAVAVAAGRELEADAVTGAGALLLGAGLVLLGALLLGIRRQSSVDRFHPAIEAYVVALGFGVVGIALGAAIAVGDAGDWWGRLRGAHLTVNVLGLVGLVLAGTLPYFVATQARMKMSRRATPRRVRASTAALAAGTVVAAAGHLAARPGLVAAGLLGYAAGLGAVAALLPVPGRRQLRWARARLVQLAAGGAWWVSMLVLLAVGQLADGLPEARVLAALAVGGFAQILVASLAYFGPVLRGGGHERLTAGFARTSSWAGLVLANVAAGAFLADRLAVAVAAGVLWALDTGWRAARLLTDDGEVERPG
jgi:nitrite reductase (NO-forming)